MLKSIAIVGLAAFGLTACQTTEIDEAIQRSLPQTCRAADAAYQAFYVYAAAGEVSDRTIERVTAARQVLEPICADPESQNTATILVAAVNAYAVITYALEEAEDN